jgi:hypothetical protein
LVVGLTTTATAYNGYRTDISHIHNVGSNQNKCH